MNRRWIIFAGVAFALSAAAAAQTDQRTEYNRRAAARDVELFGQLDRNANGSLTREEVHADLNLGPRFDDIDVNRDGIVTAEELQQYVGRRYGVQTPAPNK